MPKTMADVAIVSTTATAVTSWMAFEALGERLVRYTTTVRALENLLSWWTSLGEYGVTTEANITRLFMDGETIITIERQTVSSGAAAKHTDERGEEEKEVQALSA